MVKRWLSSQLRVYHDAFFGLHTATYHISAAIVVRQDSFA
jgi:hypothetical protein